jgi:glycine cleavage system aminomethyltransferase T
LTYPHDTDSFTRSIESVSVHDGAGQSALYLKGPEFSDWIEGVISNRLVEPDRVAYGLMLTPKATLVSDFWMWRVEQDSAVLEAPPALIQELQKTLERYRISAKVSIESTTWPVVEVVGPSAVACTAQALGLSKPTLELEPNTAVSLDGVWVVQRNRFGIPGLAIHTSQDFESLSESVLQSAKAHGGTELTDTAARSLRIAFGHPNGPDVGTERFIAETPLFDYGVTLDKAPYIGMQPLLRVTHRGRLNRDTRAVVAEASASLSADDTIVYDGREVGRLGPTGYVPALDRLTALAFIRREVPDEAMVYVGQTPTQATVRALPLLSAT